MRLTRLRRRSHEFHFSRRRWLLNNGGLRLQHEAGEDRGVKRKRNQDRRDSDARCRLRNMQRVGAP